ncbi:DMT family transporter [Seohaeicola zhoushanensis]|uniref:Membrane protein n=1 Tax=Seohaeicola zhoushanensis TaxID=1569283 RepID=A0A8J3GZL0_9RHOB|nr:DMT family transporter [Seohaeicola zhoushanensis]GHF56618.1 membrane protein [Seohaeicola zhoushanensis]
MDNLRGAVLMTLAMLGFACGDLFIKVMTQTLPTGQLLVLMGVLGCIVFSSVLVAKRRPLLSRNMLSGAIAVRNLGEIVGTVCFITALSMTTFSMASTILQTTPLAVTLGAALVLHEPVGWRRWSAICVGFLGVLIVMRPSAEGIDAGAIFALVAVAGLASRDLATRLVPGQIDSLQLSLLGFFMQIPAGLMLGLVDDRPWVPMLGTDWMHMCAAVALNGMAYVSLVTAMRVGDISFVTLLRYTRIIFALILAVVVFGDTLDAAMLAGCAIIAGSGLYTVIRERKIRARA